MNSLLRTLVATGHRAFQHGLVLGVSTAALALVLHAPIAQAQSQQNEIVKNDTSQAVQGMVPSGTNVNVSDDNMKAADHNRSDWLLHGRTYSNQRYSPLRQVNARNVRGLKPVALIQTAMPASFETTPIVVDGVMYATTPVVDNKMKIMAFNAANGDRIWETTYDLGDFKICCGPVNRGVAVGYGSVYVLTLDDELLALNAKDGKKEWESKLADPRAGFSETMAPQIYDGKVIVGSSGGEWAIRGFVAAYDAKTGKRTGAGRPPTRKRSKVIPTRGAAAWCGRRRRSIPSAGC